jgi:hypothetical protein
MSVAGFGQFYQILVKCDRFDHLRFLKKSALFIKKFMQKSDLITSLEFLNTGLWSSRVSLQAMTHALTCNWDPDQPIIWTDPLLAFVLNLVACDSAESMLPQ